MVAQGNRGSVGQNMDLFLRYNYKLFPYRLEEEERERGRGVQYDYQRSS